MSRGALNYLSTFFKELSTHAVNPWTDYLVPQRIPCAYMADDRG